MSTWRSIRRRTAHRQPEGAAGRRLRRHLRRLRRAARTRPRHSGRQEAASNIHVGIDWLASVSFGHISSIGRRVVVLGGGNTAMDCCRTARRLGGAEVKVVVRSGFDEMKASPWEKEDAMREGVEILNFLAPKAFTHDGGRLTGVVFEKMAARKTSRAPRTRAHWRAGCRHRMRRRADRGWAGKRFSLDRERHWPRFRRATACPRRPGHASSRACPTSSLAATSAFGPKNIITAVAHGHEAAISIDAFFRGEDPRDRPPPLTNLVSQKMGIHEWSYDNAITLDRRFKVPHVENAVALKNIQTEVELGFDLKQALGEAQRCLNCDVQTVFSAPQCIECDACVDVCPIDCISFVPTLPRTSCAVPDRARAQPFPSDLCLGAGQDPAGDGQGRGPLPALQALRRTLPDRRMGHDEVHNRDGAAGHTCRSTAVNDFVIRFANVNGSGSASANLLFARSIMRMGVPIAPRNIFPSNIQGLPTWYEVRVSEAGCLRRARWRRYPGRHEPTDLRQDLAAIEPGGYLFYNSTRPIAHS